MSTRGDRRSAQSVRGVSIYGLNGLRPCSIVLKLVSLSCGRVASEPKSRSLNLNVRVTPSLKAEPARAFAASEDTYPALDAEAVIARNLTGRWISRPRGCSSGWMRFQLHPRDLRRPPGRPTIFAVYSQNSKISQPDEPCGDRRRLSSESTAFSVVTKSTSSAGGRWKTAAWGPSRCCTSECTSWTSSVTGPGPERCVATQIRPSALKLATPSRPTTRWSWTAIFKVRPASMTWRVISTSADEGVGSPDG
jgi:hypothetical protein